MLAAVILTLLLGLLAVFQIALAAGAPLGHFAWGGQERVLSTGKRVGSVIAVVIYALMAWLALTRAGVVGDLSEAPAVQIGMWVVFGYAALSVLPNAISRSRAEQAAMTPVSIVLALLALIVALGG